MESPSVNKTSRSPSISSGGTIPPDPTLVKTGREEWNNHIEFFLSSLGLAVGLGNIWRFPYICYDNGGATFLIPYFIMLFIVGVPCFFMEMALGQYAGLSSTKVFARMAPGVQGLGYSMLTINTISNFQYVVVMAYAFYFLFASWQSELPWSTCQHDFNRDHCFSVTEQEYCVTNVPNSTFFEKECVNGTYFCNKNGMLYNPDVPYECFNLTHKVPFKDVTYRSSASEEYWYHKVLNFDVENGHVNTDVNSWSKWGNIQWEIVGCLALAWIVICGSVVNGVQSYGKVVYFTTLFPYVILTILLGYVATLDGFDYGIEYFFVPQDWGRLWEISVWKEAAGQIFYSLGVALGGQLLLSSYNGFKTNCHRDGLLIGAFNSITSIYAGLVVFGCLGYIAKGKEEPIDNVIQGGAGLAFIVYPEAVAIMDVPQLFSSLFFLMLCLLAISTVSASTEGLLAAIFDDFPALRDRRILVLSCVCVMDFVCGLSMCFDSGFLMFTIMNDRCANAILLMAFLELMIVSWFYGSSKMLRHITHDMEIYIPKFMQWFWWLCWTFITPAIIFVVMIISWSSYPGDLFLDYTFPPAVEALGWGLELVSIGMLIVFGLAKVYKRVRQGRGWAYIQAGPMMSPNKLWRPRPDSGLDNEALVIDKAFEAIIE